MNTTYLQYKMPEEEPNADESINARTNQSGYKEQVLNFCDLVKTKISAILNICGGGNPLKNAFGKILHPDDFKHFNLSELGIDKEIQVGELIETIANQTIVVRDESGGEINNNSGPGFIFQKIDKTSCTYPKSKKNIYSHYVTGQHFNDSEHPLHLEPEIFDFNKGEYTDEFLWHVLENYGNYQFSRYIFDNFLDEKKEKLKHHDGIPYNTEIHRFLFEVLKNEKISMKATLERITSFSDQHEELEALYILFFEINGYNGLDDVEDVINKSIEILKELKETQNSLKLADDGYSEYLEKNNDAGTIKKKLKKIQYKSGPIIDKATLRPKTKNLGNIRQTLEKIKNDNDVITTDNIIKYGNQVTANMFPVPSATPMLNSIRTLSKTRKSNDKGIPNKGDTKSYDNAMLQKLSSVSDLGSGLVSKILFEMQNTTRPLKTEFTRKMRGMYFKKFHKNDEGLELTKDEIIELTDEKSLISLKSTQSIELILENFVKSHDNELLCLEPTILKKLIAGLLTKKGFEEVVKTASLGLNPNQVLLLSTIKIRAYIAWKILSIIVKKIIGTDSFKTLTIKYGSKHGYRFDVSFELKNYLQKNAKKLYELSVLEEKKQHLENIVKKGSWALTEKGLKKHTEDFETVTKQLEKMNGDEYYNEILDLLEKSIKLQSQSFRSSLDEEEKDSSDNNIVNRI